MSTTRSQKKRNNLQESTENVSEGLISPENVRAEDENYIEKETRSFNAPTKLVRINSTQNNDPCTSGNTRETARELKSPSKVEHEHGKTKNEICD